MKKLVGSYKISDEVVQCLERHNITRYQWALFIKIFYQNHDSSLDKAYLGGMKDVLWIMVNRKPHPYLDLDPNIKKDYDILEHDAYAFVRFLGPERRMT